MVKFEVRLTYHKITYYLDILGHNLKIPSYFSPLLMI